MEEKKPKLPVTVGSIAFVIKQEQILHQQPMQAGQKNISFKVTKILSHSSLPHSCTDIPKHSSQFKAIIVVKYLGYHQGFRCTFRGLHSQLCFPGVAQHRFPVPRKKMVWRQPHCLSLFFTHPVLSCHCWVAFGSYLLSVCTFIAHLSFLWDTKV